MIFGRKWYQIRAKSKAKEGDWTVLRRTDLLAILHTGYGKSLIYQLLICFLADGLNIFSQALATVVHMLLLDLTGKLYKHHYNCFLFGPGFFLLFPMSDGLQIWKFIFSCKTTKTRNTRMHWGLQILSQKKWHDSDWKILTARHSTVEWVLRC